MAAAPARSPDFSSRAAISDEAMPTAAAISTRGPRLRAAIASTAVWVGIRPSAITAADAKAASVPDASATSDGTDAVSPRNPSALTS